MLPFSFALVIAVDPTSVQEACEYVSWCGIRAMYTKQRVVSANLIEASIKLIRCGDTDAANTTADNSPRKAQGSTGRTQHKPCTVSEGRMNMKSNLLITKMWNECSVESTRLVLKQRIRRPRDTLLESGK
jgi:hypothetical protein